MPEVPALTDHYRVKQDSGDYCDADGHDWPCPTVQTAMVSLIAAVVSWFQTLPPETRQALRWMA